MLGLLILLPPLTPVSRTVNINILSLIGDIWAKLPDRWRWVGSNINPLTQHKPHYLAQHSPPLSLPNRDV